VVEPGRRRAAGGSTAGAERADKSLGDDGADFASGGGHPVRGGAVARREAFAGYDKGGGVGAEVEEELAQDVEAKQGVAGELFEGKADDAEEHGEEEEAAELDGLAADRVDEGDGDPVTGDGTGANEDEIADGGFVEDVVDVTENKGLAQG